MQFCYILSHYHINLLTFNSQKYYPPSSFTNNFTNISNYEAKTKQIEVNDIQHSFLGNILPD